MQQIQTPLFLEISWRRYTSLAETNELNKKNTLGPIAFTVIWYNQNEAISSPFKIFRMIILWLSDYVNKRIL